MAIVIEIQGNRLADLDPASHSTLCNPVYQAMGQQAPGWA